MYDLPLTWRPSSPQQRDSLLAVSRHAERDCLGLTVGGTRWAWSPYRPKVWQWLNPADQEAAHFMLEHGLLVEYHRAGYLVDGESTNLILFDSRSPSDPNPDTLSWLDFREVLRQHKF
ncbi:hypothetical protein L6E12_26055 [Actinokineospora sp. PR83]|uniref:hypothetical protein n=1 Tax=Actinokineospora sp. PR83 TaxID=2884908 RepID=UPI001F17CE76|nr:hypothetical protein [Actinokineospora sp. PR83]MCG8919243.1 hypothetical protein [Actinokineospora sp. PR83]